MIYFFVTFSDGRKIALCNIKLGTCVNKNPNIHSVNKSEWKCRFRTQSSNSHVLAVLQRPQELLRLNVLYSFIYIYMPKNVLSTDVRQNHLINGGTAVTDC